MEISGRESHSFEKRFQMESIGNKCDIRQHIIKMG